MFIEILFKMLLFKGGVLIYAEHCIYTHTHIHIYIIYIVIYIYIYILHRYNIYTILLKVLGHPLLMNRFDYFSNFHEHKS